MVKDALPKTLDAKIYRCHRQCHRYGEAAKSDSMDRNDQHDYDREIPLLILTFTPLFEYRIVDLLVPMGSEFQNIGTNPFQYLVGHQITYRPSINRLFHTLDGWTEPYEVHQYVYVLSAGFCSRACHHNLYHIDKIPGWLL